MNGRGVRDRRAQDVLEIVTIKVLVHTCSNCSVPYYTLHVDERHLATSHEVQHVLENQTGRYMIPNLIEALTQDSVLEAVSPCAKKVTAYTGPDRRTRHA